MLPPMPERLAGWIDQLVSISLITKKGPDPISAYVILYRGAMKLARNEVKEPSTFSTIATGKLSFRQKSFGMRINVRPIVSAFHACRLLATGHQPSAVSRLCSIYDSVEQIEKLYVTEIQMPFQVVTFFDSDDRWLGQGFFRLEICAS